MEFIPCCLQTTSLLIDEIVDLRLKLRNNDPSIAQDLVNLTSNLKKYNKKDRKIILEHIKLYLELNASLNNSNASIK